VGAVSILFLFIVMLIDIRVSELQNDNRDSMPLALYIGLIFSNFILLDEVKSTGTYFVRGLLINLDNNTKLLKTEKTYLHNLFFVSSNN
jgi:NADH:ubiquinone oxidoreductase subunit 6 (subunit J)